MTTRTSENYMGASEDYLYAPTGSVLFSEPSEVDLWCQSVPSAEGLPLTPPETVSDCSLSDCADMSGLPWGHASVPEEPWTTGPGLESSPHVQQPVNHWQGHGASFSSSNGASAQGPTIWNGPHGPVEHSLSPALSHESQSSHIPYPFTEPEMPMLPPGLDLSFATAEPSWNPCGPVMYANAQVASAPMSHGPHVTNGHFATQPSAFQDQAVPQPQVYRHGFCDQTGQFTLQGHPSVAHRRPILPRTDVHAVTSQPIYGPQQRELRPQLSVSQTSQSPVSTVSNTPSRPSGLPQGMQQYTPVSSPGPASVPPSCAQRPPPADDVAPSTCPPEYLHHIRPVGPAGCQDHSEDWNSFIRFDQEEQNPHTPGALSYPNGMLAGPVPIPSVPSAEPGPLAIPQDHQEKVSIPSTAPTNVSSESDEGRHRTHPLYNEGPQADGLYHCPFEKDPNCQHKATKLKCNYDKFIDSHLKPFRCKIESCAKQEFSSTACLLRHEREAHGMHGHGDRPHLCYYPGCERGIPGNGFPRRYNLFDHMKRVHDHKDTSSRSDSPVPGGQIQAKRINRKRKATGPPEVQAPAANRPRVAIPAGPQPPVLPPQPAKLVGAPAPHHTPMPGEQHVRGSNARQRMYTQWANQREVIARQMSFVQSPDDEANLHTLSQNINELRRLSHEVRRG